MLKNNSFKIILLLHFFLTIFLPFLNNNLFQIINPLFSIFLIIIIIFKLKNNQIKITNLSQSIIITLTISILYFMSGFIFGFYQNAFLISNILKTIYFKILPIFSLELLRIYILNKYPKNFKLTIFITFYIILLEINFSHLFSIIPLKSEVFKYLFYLVIPNIIKNILYTGLLKKNNSLPIILTACFSFLLLVSPILPNYNYFLIGTFKLITLLFIYEIFKCKSLWKIFENDSEIKNNN